MKTVKVTLILVYDDLHSSDPTRWSWPNSEHNHYQAYDVTSVPLKEVRMPARVVKEGQIVLGYGKVSKVIYCEECSKQKVKLFFGKQAIIYDEEDLVPCGAI